MQKQKSIYWIHSYFLFLFLFLFLSIHTTSAHAAACSPAPTGDWVVTESCFNGTTILIPKNVSVQNNSTLELAGKISLPTATEHVFSSEEGSSIIFLAGAHTTYPIINHIIGGTVSNLEAGEILELQNSSNGQVFFITNSGSQYFTFLDTVQTGNPYSVSVFKQPSTQACQVSNGNGIAWDNVNNIEVQCGYVLGGSLTGLNSGQSLNIKYNKETLSLSNNGFQSFDQLLTAGELYQVSITRQPDNQKCNFLNGTETGVVQLGTTIPPVSIECINLTVGGTLQGHIEHSLNEITIQNGGDIVDLTTNGNFSLPAAITRGSEYNITLPKQSIYENCTITNGSGTLQDQSITNIEVNCKHILGGRVASLADGENITLSNATNGDTVLLGGNGTFAFPINISTGETFAVNISSQPITQSCEIINGQGVAGKNILLNNQIQFDCLDLTIKGTVSGLAGNITLQNIDGTTIEITQNGSFSFSPLRLSRGEEYNVTITKQPDSKICKILNESGQMGDTPIENIEVICHAIPIQVEASEDHTCVLFQGGEVKCWGHNDFGQLGYGDQLNRGDQAGQMGNNLQPIDLGDNFQTVRLTSGMRYTCAFSSLGQIKCWGSSNYFKSGSNFDFKIGDEINEMGNNLPFIDFGTNFQISQIESNSSHNCILSTLEELKCWGYNYYGQLGYGRALSAPLSDRGLVNLGTDFQIKQISPGYFHFTCELSKKNQIKCWGNNRYGQLGQGHTNLLGSTVEEMGDSLPAVDLGENFTPTQITSGYAHVCALSDQGKVKCWGQNQNQELGDFTNRENHGDAPNEMGSNLKELDLGEGFIAQKITSSNGHETCVISTLGEAKCWGGLGASDFLPGELHSIDFGSNSSSQKYRVKQLSIGWNHNCAILDNNQIKCWGDNQYGELGYGHTRDLGYNIEDMGDSLPFVSLF